MRKAILVALSLALGSLAGQAQESNALKTLVTGDDSRGWEGVGRLNIGRQSFCTGALIAPDLVLTAAHCLFDKESGKLMRTEDIEFLAGWRNGRANAYRSVKRAIAHPDFQYSGPDRVGRVAKDVAILELSQPIQKTSVRPFEISHRPRKGAEVGVVSYAKDRSESPALQEVCKVLARQSGTLVLSCVVDFGSSGSPVFVIEDGEARIVSVVSAKADVNGRSVALGTSLEGPLSDLMDLLVVAQAIDPPDEMPKVRRLTVEKQAGNGAKFLRP